MVDVLAARTWARRLTCDGDGHLPDDRLPFVSLHVPAHNEPPEMVIATLTSLLALDYPAYEIVMVDDKHDRLGLVAPGGRLLRAISGKDQVPPFWRTGRASSPGR